MVVTLNMSYYFQITNPPMHVISRALITFRSVLRLSNPIETWFAQLTLILLGKPQELPIELLLVRSTLHGTTQRIGDKNHGTLLS